VSASSPKLARRLVEPDIWTCPHGARQRPRKVLTYGPEVADVNAAADFAPDPQQELGLDLIFAINPDGTPASFEFCVICCRQNLKTGLFKQTAVGWIAVLDEPDVVWSAHEMSTTLDAQAELHEMFESAASLSRWLPDQKNRGLYTDNGSERIELINPETGQSHTIWFKARRENSGRGLARGKLILDEAFALKARMLGSLLPLMLTKPHAQVLYGSSAGKADSDALFDIRHRGRNHLSPRMTYLEWGGGPLPGCEDPDCEHPKTGLALGDPCVANRIEIIEQRNPTLTTGRITIQTLDDIRQALSTDEWFRECMGRWDDPGDGAGPPAIDLNRWSTLSQVGAPPPRRAAVVLDVEPNRSATTIGVVGDGPAGRPLALVDVHQDPAAAIAALIALAGNIEVLEVALHPSGQAGALAPALKKAGIEFKDLVHKDMGRGCSALQSTVDRGGIVHVGQSELDTAVGNARIRVVNEIQLWDRRATSVPLGPVVAVSVALQRYLELTAKPDTPPPPPVKARGSLKRRADDLSLVGF
jgi:hypothetical protein